QTPDRRRLEAAEVVPETGDSAPACIGQLHGRERCLVPEGIQGEAGHAGRNRGGPDVKEGKVATVGTVIGHIVAGTAPVSAGQVWIVEQLLAPIDLHTSWIIGM